MKPISILCLVVLFVFFGPAVAQDDHNHDHAHDDVAEFSTLEDGWAALQGIAAEIRTHVAAGDTEALHEPSDELHAVAEKLIKFDKRLPPNRQTRYAASLNQIVALADRLHEAHESGDAVTARRLSDQLDGMMQLLATVAGLE